MEQQELTRSGKPTVFFYGEEIYHGSTKDKDEEHRSRWHLVRAFVTDKGYYKVGIVYKTLWDGELNNYTVSKSIRTIDQIVELVSKAVPELKDDVTAKLLNNEASTRQQRGVSPG